MAYFFGRFYQPILVVLGFVFLVGGVIDGRNQGYAIAGAIMLGSVAIASKRVA